MPIQTYNSNYFIPHFAVSFKLQGNRYAEGSTEYSEYVSVSCQAGTKIALRNRIPLRGKNATLEIDFNQSLEYKTWLLAGFNTRFSEDYLALPMYVYARVDATGVSALVVFSPNDYDYDGGILTPPSEEEKTRGLKYHREEPTTSAYYYMPIGKITAPDPATRTRAWDVNLSGWYGADLGNLDTPLGRTSTDMFEWESGMISPLAPFREIALNDNLIWKHRQDGKDVDIFGPFLSADDIKVIMGLGEGNHYVPTIGGVDNNYLAKYKENSTPHPLHVGELTIDKGQETNPDGSAAKSTGNLTVGNNATVGNNTDIGGNLSVGGTVAVGDDATFSGESNIFEHGIEMGSDKEPTQQYTQGIRGCKIFWTGTGWMVETDYLSVNKKMYAKEIEVDKVTHVGGEQILTAASCICTRIEEMRVDDADEPLAWKVFFLRKNADGRGITNDWQVGDLAYCQTFNIDEGISEDFSNRYYWRAVIEVGSTEDEHYLVLSNSEGEFDMIGCDEEEDSPSVQSRLGCDAPAVDDHIIQFGFSRRIAQHYGNVIDKDSEKVRAGATLMSGSGKYGRSLIMWEAITTFTIPKPRLLISPQRVDLSVNSLSIRVGGGEQEKDLEEYMRDVELDGRVIINGDDEKAPTTDPAFITKLLEYVFGEEASEHTIADLVGSVYITTEKMFYLLTQREDGTYTWMDDTDGTLRQLYDKYKLVRQEIDNMLDDGCITYNEKLSLWTLYKQLLSDYDSVRLSFAPPYSQDPTIIAAYSAFGAASEALFVFFEEVIGVYANKKPSSGIVYFSDAASIPEGAKVIPYTRTQMMTMVKDFATAHGNYQMAMSDYKVNSISDAAAEQARQDAVDYVTEHLSEILDDSTKATVDKWIQDYTNGEFVTLSYFKEKEGEIQFYTQWIDDFDPNRVGGAGMWAELQKMFVGTQTITFDEVEMPDGTKQKVVSNISHNGLVTSDEMASLVSRLTDDEGNIISQASISTWIDKSFESEANATKLKSHMLLQADDVRIESGDRTFGDYFSLNNGNLWCQNLTVEGVINNLVNIIDVDRNINKDKLLSHRDDQGNVVDDFHDDLDVLRLGDVVTIRSTWNNNIYLPYYIDEYHQYRGTTAYPDEEGNEIPHAMTANELKRLVGKRLTIFLDNITGGGNLVGARYFETVNESVKHISNGTPLFEFPTEEEDFGVTLLGTKVVHLEFRLCNFRKKVNDDYIIVNGFCWCMTSYTDTDLDEQWI